MNDRAPSIVTPAANQRETEDLAKRLRAAVRSEEYEEILELLGAYNRRFEQLLVEAAGDPKETRRLFTEASALLQWAKVTSQANRAHAEVNLNRLTRAARYMPAKNGYSRTSRFQA